MSALADQLRRSFSGTPADCSCASTVSEQLRRTIDEDDSLCTVHDVAAIEKRAADAALAIARERHETLRQVVAGREAADLPECSCAAVTQAVRAGFAGEELPECALHAGPSITAQMSIGVGDDQQLLGLLSAHGITTVITEL